MAHGIDSLRETNISQHLISSKVSQSPYSMPKHIGHCFEAGARSAIHQCDHQAARAVGWFRSWGVFRAWTAVWLPHRGRQPRHPDA